ncbi:hypothetical protein PMZ80_005573 [Knufia obscura]|uniref:Uncharacterized protein n=2 Tax=Knufia TaxID=430999 RepID=A0AAN8I1V5_9EURO|nr:hypothetical protein PMZ80_005573 [Knufia obscura]KAK5950042.1 hypothetical protein OHC33_009003 [Knufia fluminis]
MKLSLLTYTLLSASATLARPVTSTSTSTTHDHTSLPTSAIAETHTTMSTATTPLPVQRAVGWSDCLDNFDTIEACFKHHGWKYEPGPPSEDLPVHYGSSWTR